MSSFSLGVAFGRYIWSAGKAGLVAVAVTLLLAVLASTHGEIFAILSCIALLFAGLYMFELFTLGGSRNQAVSGFPSHLLLAPTGDSALVLWPMAICAALSALIGLGVCLGVLRSFAAFAATWWVVPYLAANGAVFQSMAWLPLRRPGLRPLLAFVMVPSLVTGPIALGFLGPEPYKVAIGYVLLGMIASIAAVYRLGVYRHEIAFEARARALDPAARPAQPFTSALDAQIWIEEKRSGLVMKFLVGGFSGIFLLFGIAAIALGGDSTTVGGHRVSMSIMCLAAACAGVPGLIAFGGCCSSEPDNMVKNGSGLQPFLALRPVATTTLVYAKMAMACRVAGKLSLLSLVVATLLLLIPCRANEGGLPTLVVLSHTLTLKQALSIGLGYVALTLIGLKGCVSAIWIAMGHMRKPVRMALQIVPTWCTFCSIVLLALHPQVLRQLVPWLPWISLAFLIVKLAVLIPTVGALRSRRLVSDRVVLRWAAACGGLWVGTCVAGWYAIPQGGYSRWWLPVAGLCLLPLVRVALAPLAVESSRHI